MYKKVKCVPYERVLNLIEAYEGLRKCRAGTSSYEEVSQDIQVLKSCLKWFSELENYSILVEVKGK